MPPRQGPLRRIEQLRRELEAEGKLGKSELKDAAPKPAWKSSTTLEDHSNQDGDDLLTEAERYQR
jgi:hypothetical protein